MKFTVKRSMWYRGHGSHSSKLRREEDGKMCCVGFRCQAAGLPEEAYTGKGTVLALVLAPDGCRLTEEQRTLLPQAYFEEGAQSGCSFSEPKLPKLTTIGMIYELNDNQVIKDPDREEKLKVEFWKIGDEIIFVD